MLTLDDLFVAFGGPAKVGLAIGKNTEHAAAMRRRKSIPTRYWPSLIRAARLVEVDLDEGALVKIHLTDQNKRR